MTAYTNEEWMELQETLQQISISAENYLQQAERSYQAIQNSLQRVKEFIIGYEFKDQQEEILFFKEAKPRFLNELIYNLKVFYIEAGKPLGDKDAQVAYYKQAIERINVFFERNYSLYIYYRMGKSDKDASYFVREADQPEPLPEYSLDIDPRFSTIHSYKFSKIQAYERLNKYLLAEIETLTNPASLPDQKPGKARPKCVWTDAKVALIEFAYAIFSRGAVDMGKADIKDIINALEYAFNISLGNFYVVFQQNIRIRKKNRTASLDQLKEYLERYMDELDVNPRKFF